VVVDSKINSDEVEMYAETTAKGGVLEAEGMIEIKFRTKDLLECMHRLDPNLISLKIKLQEAKDDHPGAEVIRQQIKAREKQLLPFYKQIAIRFAELHDTSFRMAAKGVVKNVVKWEDSRIFFYKRLNRRLTESSLIKDVRDASGNNLSHKSALRLIKDWFLASKVDSGEELWKDDAAFLAWKDDPSKFESYLQELRAQKVCRQLLDIGSSKEELQALPEGLAALLKKVQPSMRSELVEKLREVLNS